MKFQEVKCAQIQATSMLKKVEEKETMARTVWLIRSMMPRPVRRSQWNHSKALVRVLDYKQKRSEGPKEFFQVGPYFPRRLASTFGRALSTEYLSPQDIYTILQIFSLLWK